MRRGDLPHRHRGLIGDEEVVEVPGDEPCGAGLLRDNRYDVLAVERPGFSQESLFSIVVVELVVQVGVVVTAVRIPGYRVGDGPSGKGPGASLHILFRVVGVAVHAHAHGEQLKQLSAPVLVNRLFVAQLVIQVIDHGRVAGQAHQQVGKAAESMSAEIVQLNQDLIGRHALGIANAKDPVPEQADLLFQLPGGVDHTVGPVALVGHDAGHVTPAVHVPLHHVHIQVGLLFRMEQFFNRGFVANRRPPFQLLIRRAKPGSPHQVAHQQDIVACHSLNS